MLAISYSRVSKDLHDGKYGNVSLETQQAAIRKFCAAHDYELLPENEHHDIYTGKRLRERKGLVQVRSKMATGQFAALVAYSVDRLARNPAHLLQVADEADEHKMRLDFITEPLEQTPEGRLMLHIKGYAAQRELEQILERTSRGIEGKISAGKFYGSGVVKYGYQWYVDPKRPNEHSGILIPADTAEWVAFIYNTYLKEKTIRAVCRALQSRGVPTPRDRSKRWWPETVRQILLDPAYKGEGYTYTWQQHFIDEVNKPGQVRMVRKPREEWIPVSNDNCPALVSEDTWNAVNLLLSKNLAEKSRTGKHPEDFLLKGHIYCGTCGNKMYGYPKSKDRGVWTYRCSHSKDMLRHRANIDTPCSGPANIRKRIIDADVWRALGQFLSNPDGIVDALRQTRNERPSRLVALQSDMNRLATTQGNITRDINHINRQLSSLAVEIQNERLRDITSAGLRKQLREKGEMLIAVDDEIVLVERQMMQMDLEEKEVESFQQYIGAVRDLLVDPSYRMKRLAIRMLGIKVEVHRRGSEHRWTMVARISQDALLKEWRCPVTTRYPSETCHNRTCLEVVWRGQESPVLCVA